VVCSEPPWTLATTCDACLQILVDRWDVAVVNSDEACREHFGS
jgi:hypothetical protein